MSALTAVTNNGNMIVQTRNLRSSAEQASHTIGRLPDSARHPDLRASSGKHSKSRRGADRRVRAHPKPRRQSRYVIRLPVILAELRRIVHR